MVELPAITYDQTSSGCEIDDVIADLQACWERTRSTKDFILEAAEYLPRLAMNRRFFLSWIENSLREQPLTFTKEHALISGHFNIYEDQHFMVRVLLWEAAPAFIESDWVHDHVFYTATIGYQGCGYESIYYRAYNSRSATRVMLGECGRVNLFEGRRLIIEPDDIHQVINPVGVPSLSLGVATYPERDFGLQYSLSSGKTRKYSEYVSCLRSVCTVLGHFGDERSLDSIQMLANHPNSFVRADALQALARIDPDAACGQAKVMAVRDPSQDVRQLARNWIEKCQTIL